MEPPEHVSTGHWLLAPLRTAPSSPEVQSVADEVKQR